MPKSKREKLLNDIESTRKRWPSRKLPLSAVCVEEISRTGRATGFEHRMLLAFLNIYWVTFKKRYGCMYLPDGKQYRPE